VIEAVVSPVFQRKVPPVAVPVAVKVAAAPSHPVALVTDTVGMEVTVTVPDTETLGQPKVYTQEYEVVEPGLTVIEAVVSPVLQR
jgi:hypothetical protein